MPASYTYLDYAATAPERAEVLEAERAYRARSCSVANPNSLHTLGREAARALDAARADVARALGGGFRPTEIAFASGGTESDNLAVLGMAEGARTRENQRTRVLISAIEHDAVLDLASPLRARGFEVVIVPVSRQGVVEPDALESLLDRTCALVSVMAANNETGVVQPIAELARAAHRHGALFHTDAVQAYLRVPLDLSDVDAVSIAGHKIGAGMGTGALAMRTRCPYRPQSFGGGQESGRRAGTQDVGAAVRLAAASRLLAADLEKTRQEVASRANGLYGRLCAPGTGIVPTTTAEAGEGKLPGIVSVMVPGVDSETLVLRLDAAGFEVSAGSACSSASLDPSHVLTAMGIPRDQAFCSLRVSFDERVTEQELDAFAGQLLAIAAGAR